MCFYQYFRITFIIRFSITSISVTINNKNLFSGFWVTAHVSSTQGFPLILATFLLLEIAASKCKQHRWSAS